MKLMCNAIVELSVGQSNKRFLKSCLSIGRPSVKSNEIYLLLQQANKDKNGTKYKIKDNIVKVFTKFVHEGKATIKFKEPAHEIHIRCDTLQLKSFLHVLKLALSGKVDPAIMNLSNLNPKDLKSLPKTKVVIKSIANYPVLEGFPRTTEELILVGLERKSFDRQILKLQSLRILNLSENQLTSLPKELGMLSSLQELNLANNQLGKSPITKWSWMSGSKLVQNLQILNLSSNQLTEVPYEIMKLHRLVSLHLNDNLISTLPQGLGNLSRLKVLSIAKNKLTYLPGSFKNLRLSELDISNNPFKVHFDIDMGSFCNIKIPTLVDLAAQIVIRRRIYYDASIIPLTLVHYLNRANYCLCGAACMGCFYKKYSPMNYAIAQNTKFSGVNGHQIFFECYFCSTRCIRLYSNMQ